MKSLKKVLEDNGVGNLYETLKKNGIDELSLLCRLKFEDMERYGIKRNIEKLIIMKITHEYDELDEFKDVKISKPVDMDDESDVTTTNQVSYASERKRYENIKMSTNDISFSTDVSLPGYSTGLENNKIIVCIRKRPSYDKNDDSVRILQNRIIVSEPKVKLDLEPYTENHMFSFDVAFDSSSTNDDIYYKCVSEIVRHVSRGGCGSIIAYGQTGTGKTYTMMKKDTGMIYYCIKEILKVKKEGRISFCEIYLGQVYDLLNNREKVTLREMSGVVHLANSSSKSFKSYKEVSELIEKGLLYRKMGTTGANNQSSRSHAIIILNFEKVNSNIINDSNSMILVDLAGSERGIDRKGSSSEIKTEGAEINKSLLALKECIRGIEMDKKHLPFRQSKLTQILKNSFVGSSKTCMIATISPLFDNVEHTLNTLRYASRIKESNKSDDNVNEGYTSENSVLKIRTPHITINRKGCKNLDVYKDKCMSILKNIQDRIEVLDDIKLKLVTRKLEDIYKSIE